MIQGLTYTQKAALSKVITLVGANPTYVNLYYQGVIAASEFETYNAKKLYLAWEFKVSLVPTLVAVIANLDFYNEANALSFYLNNACTDGTADTNISSSFIETRNIYFSRIVTHTYTYILFNGIKVTWP
jgi:hypothetical protein